MDARLGEHREVVQKWFLKRIPSLARRSILGVERWGLPVQLRASQRWSSVRMKTTLGFAAVDCARFWSGRRLSRVRRRRWVSGVGG